MSVFQELEKKFDIAPLPETPVAEIPQEERTVLTNVETGQASLRDVIRKGTDAMDEIMHIASSTDAPRAYEVVTLMMKAVTEASKILIDSEIAVEKTALKKQKSSVTHQQNNVFVGSTSDFMKKLRNISNDE